MRAGAKRFSTENEELLVMVLTSRPLLQLRPRDINTRQMAFKFLGMARVSLKVSSGMPAGGQELPSEDNSSKTL